eukprot:TRINITY_DN5_c0_g1_i5.p1 TRINITY_DN5_c0_g1~~TRINITY_DN5_c0_g1_i5.p1  ORF type:complete len:326 (+),score=84.55 TRINITY_DN5_c0_g1_i5:150-1127(+)
MKSNWRVLKERGILLTFGENLCQTFFEETSTFKYTIPSGNDPSFQLLYESLPRFFNKIYSCGIDSVIYSLESPRELWEAQENSYLLISQRTSVEYKYSDSCVVVVKGGLKVTFSRALKILVWDFEHVSFVEYCLPSNFHAVSQMNRHKINEYGLPPELMLYFELSQDITHMLDTLDLTQESYPKRLEPVKVLSSVSNPPLSTEPLSVTPTPDPLGPVRNPEEPKAPSLEPPLPPSLPSPETLGRGVSRTRGRKGRGRSRGRRKPEEEEFIKVNDKAYEGLILLGKAKELEKEKNSINIINFDQSSLIKKPKKKDKGKDKEKKDKE